MRKLIRIIVTICIMILIPSAVIAVMNFLLTNPIWIERIQDGVLFVMTSAFIIVIFLIVYSAVKKHI